MQCKMTQIRGIVQALSGGTSTGALTYSFIQAADNNRGSTYSSLLNAMRHKIREAKTGVEMVKYLSKIHIVG